jgi:hypothetical protein
MLFRLHSRLSHEKCCGSLRPPHGSSSATLIFTDHHLPSSTKNLNFLISPSSSKKIPKKSWNFVSNFFLEILTSSPKLIASIGLADNVLLEATADSAAGRGGGGGGRDRGSRRTKSRGSARALDWAGLTGCGGGGTGVGAALLGCRLLTGIWGIS